MNPQGRNAEGSKSQVAPDLLPDEERSGPSASPTDHLSRFVPLGFIWDGRCFEFMEGGGTREVEGWSGEGRGFTWEIGRMTDKEVAEIEAEDAL